MKMRQVLAAVVRRGGWAVVDQAVVSIGSFGRNIMLAYFLAQDVFGAYGVLILPAFFLLASFHAALIVYPVQVRSAALEPHERSRFASASLCLTILLGIPLSLLMATASGWAAIRAGVSVPMTALCSGLALMALLIQELFRRTLTARLKFAAAIPGDAVAYLLPLAMLPYLARGGRLGGYMALPWAMTAMAACSLLGALIQAIQVRLGRCNCDDLIRSTLEFWRIGKWMLAANLTTLITDLPYNYLVGLRHSLTSGAHYRVISDFMRVANPILFSVTGLIVPTVAQVHVAKGFSAARRVGLRYAMVGAAILGAYFLLLLTVPGLLLGLIYPPEYAAAAAGVRIFAVTGLIGFSATLLLAILNGLGHPRSQFLAQVSNMLASLLIGLPATFIFGLWGALWGGLFATLAFAMTAMWQFHRTARARTITQV